METVGAEAAGKLYRLIRGRKDALVPGKDSIGECTLRILRRGDVVGVARRRGRVRVISRWTMASGRVVWIKLRVVQPPVLFSVSCAVS